MFLDANVIFSAALSREGVGAAIVELAALGFCEALSSKLACGEAERNLRAKAPDAVARWHLIVAALTITPEADTRLRQQLPRDLPDNDRAVLAAAVAARADILITGDRRHFGPLFERRVGGTLVLPPRQALDLVLSAAGS